MGRRLQPFIMEGEALAEVSFDRAVRGAVELAAGPRPTDPDTLAKYLHLAKHTYVDLEDYDEDKSATLVNAMLNLTAGYIVCQ